MRRQQSRADDWGQDPYGQQDGQPQRDYPPQGYPPPPQPPRRKRRTGRAVLLGITGVAVVIIVATVASSHGSGSAPAVSAPAATPAASASPAAAAAPAKPQVLISFDGNGIKNSAPFNVGSGPLTVKYSFNCSAFGQAGNFAADLLRGNQASLSSDDQPIANALAMSGSTTTTVYPQDPGKDYYLSVDSECSWEITVSS